MKYWPRGQQWQICERFWLTAPQWQRDVIWCRWGWHGGDEYGNCSVYLITALTGGFTFFYELDFQRDVLLPGPGVHPWLDRRYDPDFYGKHKNSPGYLTEEEQ